MCVKEKKGYRLTTGKLVEYDNPDFSQLTVPEFTELSKEKISAIEFIPVKKGIIDILNGIDEIKKSYVATQKELKGHTLNCPIQKPAITNMIKDEIESMKEAYRQKDSKLEIYIKDKSWEGLKEKIINGKSLIAAIAFWIISGAVIGGVFYGLSKLINNGV